jgi:glycosyltransferase involved in cell wall biosynthesis
MSVPVVLATTARTPGGVWRHVLDLAQGLAARGRGVIVGLDRDAGALHAEASGAGLRVCVLHDMPRDGALLHIHLANTFDTGAVRLIAAHRRHGPVVLTEHLPRTNASDRSLLPGPRTPGAAAAKDLFKLAQYRMVDHVIAVGASSAAFMQRWRPPRGRVSVVRNGVSAERYPRLPLPPEGAPHLVIIGTLNVQRGPDVLADALVRTANPWRATFLGEGPQRADVEARVASIAAGRVVLAGWQDAPAATVATAHLVCMPSRWESFPYAALEAGLWGRALLATAVDGPDEIVEPGVTGLLVPPEDPAALAQALDRLAAQPTLLAEMGARARERIEARYTVDAMVDGTDDVYDRVVSARR